ncbi:sensor histidine kinase [Breznakiella homolactica]|uniref:histidine kinase n=1 Tax=Breznakiella homolactica TaxID=2798577 RepID=A0A7T7XPS3_9SPIR|nr:histidine kinase [Breznakiella homolactica]QQO10153.1 histidine kinase [Breznakiella homolactica]
MNTIGSINISLEIFSSILSLIIIVCLSISENRNTRLNRLFIIMLAFNIGVLLSDAVTWILDSNTQWYSYYLIRIANFCVYSFGYIILAFFNDYLITYLAGKTKISRIPVYVISGLCAAAVLLVFISQFNHMYYYFDENNVYHRSEWYWLSQVWAIIIMLTDTAIIILYRKAMNRREFISFLSYGVLPVAAMIIQILVYGLTLLYIGTTLSLLIIYVSIQVEQTKLLKAKDQELAESRISIMLSQIQPHFLYNVLVVIKQLCDIDPPKAKEAVMEFAEYLRGNLDSLQLKTPIPFDKELRHVENYLSLEKKRFGDLVSLELDIHVRDFLIPSLTLQPLVENAVRYGVSRTQGGTIRITAAEADEQIVITVADDGAGFDPSHTGRDGRSHVGIENVRNRLAAMCCGTLTVNSAPGKGTIVTITLPRKNLQAVKAGIRR